MSQIEQNIRLLFSKHPEIERCVQKNLINRRSLARHLIKQGIAQHNEMEAVVATLRRYDFRKFADETLDIISQVRIQVKDNITMYDFVKEKSLVHELKELIDSIKFEQNDTCKVVVGTSSVKVIIDKANKVVLKAMAKKFKLNKEYTQISELSLIFPEKAVQTKGIISFITRELHNNDILITELLTATPELLIYVEEPYVLKAYEIMKGFQKVI